MKAKIIQLVLGLCILLSLSACGKSTLNFENSLIFSGTATDNQNHVSVEVLIENNEIKHIELIESNQNLAFNKQAIIIFEDMMLNKDLNKEKYDSEYTLLYDAVENALDKANLTFDSIQLFEKELPHVHEYDYDVVIVGAGGAGLTAAIEAKNQGFEKVAILEKMSYAGGNTRMSNGCYGANGNWVQPLDIQKLDTNDIFFNDIFNGGYQSGNKTCIHTLVDNALSDAYWLKEEIKVPFLDNLTWYEGHTYIRSLRIEKDGIGLIDALLKKTEEMNIDIFYTTTATSLTSDTDKSITGVIAQRNEEMLTFNSKYGVVLSTGGFSANQEMCQQVSDLEYFESDHFISTNSPGSTGDGKKLASEVNASIIHMDKIQFYPVNNPATGNFYRLDYARLNDNALLINKEGKRFINEHETRDIISNAVLAQSSNEVYELIDTNTMNRTDIKNLYSQEIASCLEQGVLHIGTLLECANYFGIPYQTLLETITNYNEMAINQYDNDFNRTDIQEINVDGEFIVFSSNVSVHHTMGGIEIDEFAHVLDINKEPIKNLYAAGEVTGSLHGDNRLGSLALTDAIVFGRIAAQSIKNDQ